MSDKEWEQSCWDGLRRDLERELMREADREDAMLADIADIQRRDRMNSGWDEPEDEPEHEAPAMFKQRDALEARITRAGYTVLYVEYCEDSDTPGLLGMYRGVTDRQKRLVKIGLKANRTPEMILDCLEHECRHVEEPDWDCGNRDVFGRGGK